MRQPTLQVLALLTSDDRGDQRSGRARRARAAGGLRELKTSKTSELKCLMTTGRTVLHNASAPISFPNESTAMPRRTNCSRKNCRLRTLVAALLAALALAATALAIVWANSPWQGAYEDLWSTELSLTAPLHGFTIRALLCSPARR